MNGPKSAIAAMKEDLEVIDSVFARITNHGTPTMVNCDASRNRMNSLAYDADDVSLLRGLRKVVLETAFHRMKIELDAAAAKSGSEFVQEADPASMKRKATQTED